MVVPAEVIAVWTECWLSEEFGNELVALDLVDLLLLNGPTTAGDAPCLTLLTAVFLDLLCNTAKNHGLNWRIDRALEMTSDARTKAGNHLMSDIACARSQQYTNDLDFCFGSNEVVCYKIT